MRVTVIRAFLIRGERVEPGSELELDDRFALELLHTGRVAAVSAVPMVRGPITTETSPGLVFGAVSTKKGKSNAGKSSARG